MNILSNLASSLFNFGGRSFSDNIKFKKDTSNKSYRESILRNEQIGKDDLFAFDFFNKSLDEYLNEKEYIKDLLSIVYRRYIWHLIRVRRLKAGYAWKANLLNLIIPLYSAVLTFFLTTDIFDIIPNQNSTISSKAFLSAGGFGLTIITILDSTWKPYQKSLELSNALIELNSWLVEFNIELLKILREISEEPRNGEDKIICFALERDKAMTEIGEQLLISLNQTSNKL